MKYLSQEQRERFDQDGFLVIDGFLSVPETAVVEAGIARVAAEHANLECDAGGFNLEKVGDASFDLQARAKRPGMLRKIQGAVFAVPEVRAVFTGERMLDCMEDLMGPGIWYHSSKVMFKPARGGAAKPWHQDAAYWPQFASDQITVWIAIHDATVDNGCVWAIPGSHRRGLISHSGSAELLVGSEAIDVASAVPVPVRPGGLLIFHSLVLHMSHKNTSDRDRWCIICDYDPRPNPTIEDYWQSGGSQVGGDGVWCLRQPERVPAR